MRDKEATVRMQAVVALSKLQQADEDAEPEDDEESVTAVLVDVLTHDPAAYAQSPATNPNNTLLSSLCVSPQ